MNLSNGTFIIQLTTLKKQASQIEDFKTEKHPVHRFSEKK